MKPLVIFEIANNHMGNSNHAIKIIDKYYKISLKFRKQINFAIKFQFRDLDTFIHEKFKNSRNKQVIRFETTRLSKKEWKKILLYSKKRFQTICTPFDENSVIDVVKNKFDFLKIASCSANDWPLLEQIANKAKNMKIICSLGGTTLNEIRNIVSFFDTRKMNVKYLYCVAKYPSNPDEINLNFISYLKQIYNNKTWGYSTHELPDESLSGGLAYALGSRIFEKHVGVKTNKYNLNGYSTNPNQMVKWLQNLSDSVERCGSINARSSLVKKEKDNLIVFKRGIYIKSNIKKGNIIKSSDIKFAFPASKNQLTANHFSKFCNFVAKQNLLSGNPLKKLDVNIVNKREKIESIRNKILNLIDKSKVIVKKNSKIEISHHYGLEQFSKYGLTMITIINENYCKKLLFLLKKQNHPAQYHKKKQESFFILYGKIRLELKKNKKRRILIMNVGDFVTIYPNEIHSFTSLSNEGAVIEELSSSSIKTDSYYVDKSINKNKNRKSLISLN